MIPLLLLCVGLCLGNIWTTQAVPKGFPLDCRICADAWAREHHFCILRLVTPRPPLSLGFCTVSQATRLPPLFFVRVTSPQALLSYTINIINDTSWQFCTHCISIGVSAEFTIWSLPEYESQVAHTDRHLSTLSIIGVKSSIPGLVVPIGSPR